MEVSYNRGTPKSPNCRWIFLYKHHPFGVSPWLWKPPRLGKSLKSSNWAMVSASSGYISATYLVTPHRWQHVSRMVQMIFAPDFHVFKFGMFYLFWGCWKRISSYPCPNLGHIAATCMDSAGTLNLLGRCHCSAIWDYAKKHHKLNLDSYLCNPLSYVLMSTLFRRWIRYMLRNSCWQNVERSLEPAGFWMSS